MSEESKEEKVINSFKKDLQEVADRFKLERVEHDNYNGMDEFIGTTIYLKVGKETYYKQSLNEILTEVFGEIGRE